MKHMLSGGGRGQKEPKLVICVVSFGCIMLLCRYVELTFSEAEVISLIVLRKRKWLMHLLYNITNVLLHYN